MMFIVRQPDGSEIGVHAERLEVETSGDGHWRFIGPKGAFLELPSRKVEHVRLLDEAWPDRHEVDEEPLEPRTRTRSG